MIPLRGFIPMTVNEASLPKRFFGVVMPSVAIHNPKPTIQNGFIRWFGLLWLMTLAACTPAVPATSLQTQTVDGLTITLEATAAPQINDRQLFTITLTDAQGQPVVADDVYLNFDMPAMPMGTNRPIAEPVAPGRYTAVTVYTMSGDWTIDVVATVAGIAHRAQFTMLVSE